jgi:hypothetical protein
MALKENYKDDILDVSVNTKRKYRMTENGDGTVSFEDETEYLQEGDNFGSGAINPIAHAINGLNNYNFHPSGSIDLVAYIADDSYYLNEDNKYVLADSPTGQALITSEPNTYKALASDTDLYGIEGADTVSGFEPSSTPITVGGETLSTIDDKLNYLVGEKVYEVFQRTSVSGGFPITYTVTQEDVDNYRFLIAVGGAHGNSFMPTSSLSGVDNVITMTGGSNSSGEIVRWGLKNNLAVGQTISYSVSWVGTFCVYGCK